MPIRPTIIKRERFKKGVKKTPIKKTPIMKPFKPSKLARDNSKPFTSAKKVYEDRTGRLKRGQKPSLDYASKHLYPTGGQFETKFMDSRGREYKFADGTDWEAMEKTGKLMKPHNKMLYIKIPKGYKRGLTMPEREEILEISDPHGKQTYTGKLTSITWDGKGNTASCLVSDWTTSPGAKSIKELKTKRIEAARDYAYFPTKKS